MAIIKHEENGQNTNINFPMAHKAIVDAKKLPFWIVGPSGNGLWVEVKRQHHRIAVSVPGAILALKEVHERIDGDLTPVLKIAEFKPLDLESHGYHRPEKMA